MKAGNFVISLDFELIWGVRDKRTIETYGKNIENVPIVITKLLSLFREYDIHTTFATVGFLFVKNKNELIKYTPNIKPSYLIDNLSPYNGHYDLIDDIQKEKYHFAPNLIKQISNEDNQEVGTHTHSHYYCLEENQSKEEFEEDLILAQSLLEKDNLKMNSIVFPRNQINHAYLKVCSKYGIKCYRGNPISWFFYKDAKKLSRIFQRAVRFIDRYINITGHHSYNIEQINKEAEIINVPASRFLSPYSKKFSRIESLRLNRIKNQMSYAAKKGLTYHLWWHPHNFGEYMDENFIFLEKILIHYKMLQQRNSFKSLNMYEASLTLTNT